MFKSINETLDYIYSFMNLENNIGQHNINKEYSLDNIKKILNYFDNPQNNKKIIHIAGTKGKGSCVVMISSLLREMGYNCTTFLSPHLIKVNERILYNLKEIKDSEIIEIVNKIEPVLTKNRLIPTTFELLFLIFLIYSNIKKVDYLVIETGLGGRLDCTNIVDPLISLITSISFDHTNILGNTIEEIAKEKGGIIKNNKPVVISSQIYNKTIKIFQNIAKLNNSPVYFVDKYFKILNIIPMKSGINFSFKFLFDKEKYTFTDFFIPLLGKHQINNFLSSFLTLYLIEKEKLLDFMNNSRKLNISIIRGRIELLREFPPLILDVAHNEDSAKKLVDTIKFHFKIKKWIILSSIAGDKDIINFYKHLKEISDGLILTSLSKYKKSNPQEIYNKINNFFKNIKLIENQEEAIDYTLNLTKPIIVTGSFYLAGPFLEKFLNEKKN